MSSTGPLKDRSKKDLAELAKRQGIAGWDSLSKDDLIRALERAAKAKAAQKAADQSPTSGKNHTKPTSPASTGGGSKKSPIPNSKAPIKTTGSPIVSKSAVNGTVSGTKSAAPSGNGKPTPSKASPTVPPVPVAKSSGKAPVAKSPAVAASPAPTTPGNTIPIEKDLSGGKPAGVGPIRDRVFLMVPDPYWLHATWELTHQSVQRAEAALRQDWHGARPIIRLFDVTSTDTTSTSETPIRDIIIHGGCNNWYIDIQQPPRQYRADIGYISRRGEFFVLARSNVAAPPKAGTTEAIEVGWADLDPKKAERIMAMSSGFESSGHPELKELFEERLRRPMGAPKDTGFGTGATLPSAVKKFFFEIDAELIVYGKTEPSAHVTLQNEPVKLRADGTFTMLFSLPDSRQIIPAVATSIDGTEERTIVLAIERNTKHLDPMIHDQMND